MKIRVLRNLGKDLPDYREGQEVEVRDALGEELAKKGLAEIVSASAPKKTKKSEPKPSEPEEVKPAEPPETKTKQPPANAKK